MPPLSRGEEEREVESEEEGRAPDNEENKHSTLGESNQ